MTAKVTLVSFVGVLAFLVYSANRGQLPEVLSFYQVIPMGDKVGHFFLMGVFAFLATLVSGSRRIAAGGLAVPVGAAIVFLVVALEELSQIFVPARTFSWLDLTADVAGIAAFGWLAVRLTGRKGAARAGTAEGDESDDGARVVDLNR